MSLIIEAVESVLHRISSRESIVTGRFVSQRDRIRRQDWNMVDAGYMRNDSFGHTQLFSQAIGLENPWIDISNFW